MSLAKIRGRIAPFFHLVDQRLFDDRIYLYLKAYLLERKDSLATGPQRVIDLSDRPVLIGGCGRSGTTLVLSVLSSHPRIHSIEKETQAFCRPAYQGKGSKSQVFRTYRIYYQLLHKEIARSCTRWCEKTPKNVHFIREILEYFGGRARFIHVVRDGRDVITSRHPLDPDSYWVSKERWVSDVSAGLEFEDHPQVLTMRYEDLVSDYGTTVRSICDFLGEDFAEQMLSYPRTAQMKASTAWFRPARVPNESSIGRWRHPEHREVVDELLEDPRALKLLKRCGYEANTA